MAERRAAVRNASSPSQVAAARDSERLAAEQLDSDLRAILSTAAGIRTFCTLLERWSAWSTVFSPDALAMAHRAGKQDVAHELMLMAIDAKPDAMELITREHERRYIESQRPTRDKKDTNDSESSESTELENDG